MEHLPRVSRQSCRSADDTDGNEMIPGALLSPCIYLSTEENSGKPQLGDHRCAISYRLKCGYYYIIIIRNNNTEIFLQPKIESVSLSTDDSSPYRILRILCCDAKIA